MALIICSNCGKEFSDLAQACPNCARPNVVVVSSQTQPQTDTRKFIPLVPPKKHNYGVGFIVYLGLLLIGVYMQDAADSFSNWKIVGLILSCAGGFGLFTIVLRVIFRLMQKV